MQYNFLCNQTERERKERMGDCERNCKRREELAAMESSTLSFSKKMKIPFDFSFEEFNFPSLINSELHQDHRFCALSPDKIISPATSSNSGGFRAGDISSSDSVACRSSSNESSLLVKDSLRFVDLEVNTGRSKAHHVKSFETESSTCIDSKFSREATPSSKFYGYTDDMDSTAVVKTRRTKLPAKKMPNQEEIDEFFAEAEKKDQKRFAEKYNYDIVKDVPLEGRYQWIRLKP